MTFLLLARYKLACEQQTYFWSSLPFSAGETRNLSRKNRMLSQARY